MGITLRHFNALMRKNWIVWKRNPLSSICQLISPAIFMALIVWLRTLFSRVPIDSANLLLLKHPMYVVNEFNGQLNTLKTSQQLEDFFLYSNYTDAFGVGYDVLYDFQSPIFFLPTNCDLDNSFVLPKVSSPIIAVVGTPNNVTAQTASYIQAILNTQNQAGIYGIGLRLEYFDSQDALNEYISSENYLMPNQGVCFGFEIVENGPADYEVNMFFDDQRLYGGLSGVGIPSQKLPEWTNSANLPKLQDYQKYSLDGYSFIQNIVATMVLRQSTGVPSASISVMAIPMQSNAALQDKFAQFWWLLGDMILLCYLVPIYTMVFYIVIEKESKAKESMRMMGLTDFPYWASWLCYYTIINTSTALICVAVLSINVISYSSKLQFFAFIWLFGESLYGQIILIQALFQKSKYAGIVASVIYMGLIFINLPIISTTAPITLKWILSLIPQVNLYQTARWLLEFEGEGFGVHKSNAWSQYGNFSFNESLINFALGFFIFLAIGLYLEAVIPSEYGRRKHPCFLCKPQTYGCCRRRNQNINMEQVNQYPDLISEQDVMEYKNMPPENYEPVQSEIARQELDGSFLRIKDLEKIYDNGFHAVKGINLKMYQNQIFALLGQNGAGKSTTISMLTGLIENSKGTAKVFDIDMFKETNKIRQFMGICPQHDVLFDYLTPKEHLSIFFDFKGGDPVVKAKEIQDLIKDVGLEDDDEKQANSLSGGGKRKLSVAIAMCGGSKLVLLDEPTAGMDLGARRKMWDMLKNYRRDKIIILTTHYMDEADVLGDRIGIMSHGQMKCLGSSLFLKNRFGAGYKLTLVKQTKQRNFKIMPYLEQHLGKIELISEVSSEISFGISSDVSSRFKEFFKKFDQDLDQLNIISYGISITTLEEVFLHINKELGVDLSVSEEKKLNLEKQIENELIISDKDPFDTNNNRISIENPQYRNNVNNSYQTSNDTTARFSKLIADEEQQNSHTERFVNESTTYQNVKALLKKRFHIYKRDRCGLACEVIVPFVMVIFGSALTKIIFNKGPVERLLSPTLYPNPQRILMNNNTIVDSGIGNISPQLLFNNLPYSNSNFEVTYFDTDNFTQFYDQTYKVSNTGNIEPYRYGSYQIYRANNITQTYHFNAFLNLTSQDVAAAYPQFMYQSILKVATGNPNFSFQMTTVPYPNLYVLSQRAQTGSAFDFVFMVAIGVALIPCVMVSFILKERDEGLKHMQLISGMSLTAYWMSNMIADIIKVYIPCIMMIVISYVFKVNYADVWVLFLMLPIALVPFSYVTTFLFGSDSTGQILTLAIHFLMCGIMAPVVFTMQAIPQTFYIGDKLRWYCCVVPSFALINGILWSSSGSQITDIRQSNIDLYPQLPSQNWAWKNLGGDAAVLLAHFVIDSMILLIIETGVFGFISRFTFRSLPPRDISINIDEDVRLEEMRVEHVQDEVVRVSGFRKLYTTLFGKPYLAVENISFGLDYGECFALLGVNGAGKTTTFKSLTAEIIPTKGDMTIKGYDIWKQFNKARKLIGYCPQDNAIFQLLTVEEHLYFYASLKGIPTNKQKDVIERAIIELNLLEHRNKPAGTLSGGNKRKLSVAMATLGNPPIILLDEPSAGMDPEARRFMWSVVANISQRDKQSAVILSTHSMEEAEALSTKMGIMARGGVFRCFGSAQHIKNKFGTGYEIEIKIQKPNLQYLEEFSQKIGFRENLNERIDIDSAIIKAKLAGIDHLVVNQIKLAGLGSDMAIEAEQNKNTVKVKNLIVYFYTMMQGFGFVKLIAEQFKTVDLYEQCSDFFKFRIGRLDKSIGFLFGLIEDNKKRLLISEYSVCQTSLEQIFQTFANQKQSQQKVTYVLTIGANGEVIFVNKAEQQITVEY